MRGVQVVDTRPRSTSVVTTLHDSIEWNRRREPLHVRTAEREARLGAVTARKAR